MKATKFEEGPNWPPYLVWDTTEHAVRKVEPMRLDARPRHFDSLQAEDPLDGLWSCANHGKFGVRADTPQRVDHCLKRTVIPEVPDTELPYQGNPESPCASRYTRKVATLGPSLLLDMTFNHGFNLRILGLHSEPFALDFGEQKSALILG